jgi:hypothetical protein
MLRILILGGITAAAACAQQPNTLTPAERQAGWKLLFDGKSLSEWHDPRTATPPGDAWSVEDGAIRTHAGPRFSEDLVSKSLFGDFELAWEWKISPGGNSGVKYRIQDRFWLGQVNPKPEFSRFEDLVIARQKERRPPRGNAVKDQEYVIGFEYQLIDDLRHPDALRGAKQQAGALYNMVAPAKKASRPAGEWNESRIILRGNRVEHWLNGEKVVDTSLDDPAVEEAAARRWGKSAIYEMLTRQPKKRCPISLQNHGDNAWFRNLRIRELK